MVELRTICSITSGQGAPQDNNEYVNGLHTFIKASDLDTIIKDDSEVNSTKITEQAIKKHNYKIFPKNTIIFAKSGQSCKKNRVYLTKEKSCIVNHLCCLYDIDKKYDPKWLKLFIKSFNVTKLIRDDSYPSIALKDISCIQVPEIEITKQREIVVLIDAMNRLLSNKKEQLKQLDEVVKSRFIEMFGDAKSSKYPTKKLIDVCDELFAGGDVKKNALSQTRTEEFPIPIYTNGEKNDGLYGYTNKARVCREAVTISGRGTIGYTSLRTEPFYPAVRLIVAVPNTEYISGMYLKHFIATLEYNGQGNTIPQLTVPMVKDECIPVPPISLQNTFAEFVKQVDKSKFVNPLSQEFFMRNFYVFIIYHCITKGCINFCMPK